MILLCPTLPAWLVAPFPPPSPCRTPPRPPRAFPSQPPFPSLIGQHAFSACFFCSGGAVLVGAAGGRGLLRRSGLSGPVGCAARAFAARRLLPYAAAHAHPHSPPPPCWSPPPPCAIVIGLSPSAALDMMPRRVVFGCKGSGLRPDPCAMVHYAASYQGQAAAAAAACAFRMVGGWALQVQGVFSS